MKFLSIVSLFLLVTTLTNTVEAGLFKRKKPPVVEPGPAPVVEPGPVVEDQDSIERRKKPKEPEVPVHPPIYNYGYWFPTYLEDYMKLVDQAPATQAATAGGEAKCMPMFKNPITNGVMDIRYALGYFDDSQGIDIIYNNFNYGLSPSLDIEIFKVLRGFFTKKCEGTHVLCGFQESGDPAQGKLVYEKKIILFAKEVTVRMTMTQASASDSFVENKSTLKERQDFLTKQSEENYFGGLGIADIVFYNGHSRNGGGPDFNPPLLGEDLHVNYDGYYKVQRPGIKRVLSQLRTNPNKDSVIGLFSCFSESHFFDMLTKANPKQRMVLSSDKINYLDSLEASIGYLEGLLRGQCGQNLADIAKQGDSVKLGFKGFQIR